MSSSLPWSSYFDNLPRVYREGAASGDLLNRFLLAFEAILTDHAAAAPGPDGLAYALEEILDGVPGELAGFERYFTPGPGRPELQRAPSDFLAWLASWVAVDLDPDLDDEQQRRLLAEAVQVYRRRGTAPGLALALGDFSGQPGEAFTVREILAPFQVGISARVGVDTWLGGAETVYPRSGQPGGQTYVGGAPAFFFDLVVDTGKLRGDLVALARALPSLLAAHKPAATWYRLRYDAPTPFTVGASRIGVLPDPAAGVTSSILVHPGA